MEFESADVSVPVMNGDGSVARFVHAWHGPISSFQWIYEVYYLFVTLRVRTSSLPIIV